MYRSCGDNVLAETPEQVILTTVILASVRSLTQSSEPKPKGLVQHPTVSCKRLARSRSQDNRYAESNSPHGRRLRLRASFLLREAQEIAETCEPR